MADMAKKPAGVRVARRRHATTYYFQRRIPTDLLKAYPEAKAGKIEAPLPPIQTDAYREAMRLWADLDDEFIRVRMTGSRQKTAIRPEEVRQMTSEVLSSMLGADEEIRTVGMIQDDDGFALHRRQVEELEAEARSFLARGVPGYILSNAVQDQLTTRGFDIPVGSDSFREVMREFARLFLEAARVKNARDLGDDIPTPKPAEKPKRVVSVETLATVLEKWAAEHRPKAKTADEARLVVKEFEKATGGSMRITDISKAQVVAYKDSLLARTERPLSASTITKRLSFIKTLLSYAERNDIVSMNVAAKVTVGRSKVERDQRLPFTREDLRDIFAGPVHAAGARPRAGAGEAAFWIPLLSMYTGARPGELAQLQVTDVQQEDHVPFLLLWDLDEGQSMKTASSRRRVPIHADLIKLGFFKYRDGVKRTGAQFLFPDLVPTPDGDRAKNFGKWFGRYLRGPVGITDKRRVFYSFRHTFKDACRDTDLSIEIHDRLTGHAPTNVGGTYGTGPSLHTLNEAIQRVKFPSVDLKKIRGT
jgi:integrase